MSPRKRKPRSSGNVQSIKPCTLFKVITRAPKTRSKSQKLTSGSSKQKSSNMSELDWDDGSKFKVVVWKGKKPGHDGEVQGARLGAPRGTAVESGTSFSNETVTKGTKREGTVAEVANKPGSEWGFIRCRSEKEDADTSKSISSNNGRLMVESAAKGSQAQSVEHEFIDDTELKGRSSRSASCLSLDMVPSEVDNSLDSTFDDTNLSIISSEASDLSLEATFTLSKRLRKIRTRLAESEAAVQASDAAVQAAF